MKFRIAVVAGLMLSTVAHAEQRWHGAGWYQVVEYRRTDMPAWKFIYGEKPFKTEAACLKDIHPDYVDPGVDQDDSDTVNHFSCEHLVMRPEWDKD